MFELEMPHQSKRGKDSGFSSEFGRIYPILYQGRAWTTDPASRMCEALDHGEYSNNTLLHVLPDLPSINQEIVYICDGEEHVFQPEFFYSGFRYALVEGMDICGSKRF